MFQLSLFDTHHQSLQVQPWLRDHWCKRPVQSYLHLDHADIFHYKVKQEHRLKEEYSEIQSCPGKQPLGIDQIHTATRLKWFAFNQS